MPHHLSVIVPVLNEADGLSDFLSLLLQRLPANTEVILVDGGSDDASCEIASEYPVRLVKSDKGRAAQMNCGARQASGQYLLFLHADTQLSKDFPSEFQWWASTRPVWGFSPIQLAGDNWWCRLIETGINLRTQITAGASGDQAQIVDTRYFKEAGGFQEIALMEDIQLSYFLRRAWPVRKLRMPVTTSSRRWQSRGVLKTVLLMWFLRCCYRLGVSPRLLERWYSQA